MAAKRQAVFLAIGALIIIGILVLIGVHNVSNLYVIPAGTFDPSQGSDSGAGPALPEITVTQPAPAGFGSALDADSTLYDGDNVIATYGNRNRIPGNESINFTSDNPGSFTDAIQADMEPYLYPKGPVIGLLQESSGTFEVIYYQGWPVNRTLMDEMYSRIAAKGKDYGFEQIPCRVLSMEMVQSDIVKDTVTPRATESTS